MLLFGSNPIINQIYDQNSEFEENYMTQSVILRNSFIVFWQFSWKRFERYSLKFLYTPR